MLYSTQDGIKYGIRNDIGHFNVFQLAPFQGNHNKSVHYKKRDYFKITLLIGQSAIEYANKVIPVQRQALVFSNPKTPYRWVHSNGIHHGFFCIFDALFFHHYGNFNQYEIFQPEGNHVFELTDQQVIILTDLYQRMFEAIDSDYLHKYDLLRTLVNELIHFAMKI